MSLYSNSNPFLNPTSNYGGRGKNGPQTWQDTPFVKNNLDKEIPHGVYTDFLGMHGMGGNDRQSTWAAGLYDKTQSGYQAALRHNPALTYLNYLKMQFGGDGLNQQWAALTPNARGERVSNYSPDVRMIAWG